MCVYISICTHTCAHARTHTHSHALLVLFLWRTWTVLSNVTSGLPSRLYERLSTFTLLMLELPLSSQLSSHNLL